MTAVNNARRKACILTRGFRFVLVICWCCNWATVYGQQEQVWQMHHAAWSSHEGAPRDINGVAEGKDGRLWLASEQGLYSFNGFDFLSVTLPSDTAGVLQKSISQLLIAADGSAWFTRRSGGVLHLQGPHLESFDREKGKSGVPGLTFLQQDRSGTIWAVIDDEAPGYLGADRQWHRIAFGRLQGGHVQTFLIDSHGTRWLVFGDRLYRQGSSEDSFKSTSIEVHAPALIREGSENSIWISGFRQKHEKVIQITSSVWQVDQQGSLLHRYSSPGNIRDFIIDKFGSAWFAVEGGGVRKLSRISGPLQVSPPSNEAFLKSDGLTSNDEWCLFEDSEGDVWAAGARGLDRFAPSRLPPLIRTQASGTWSTCSEATGDVLLGEASGPLMRLHNGTLSRIEGSGGVNGLFCSNSSTLLLDSRGLAKVDGARVIRIPNLPAHSGFWDNYIFASVAEVGNESLYAWATGAKEDALWRYDGSQWHRSADSRLLGSVIALFWDGKHLFLGRRDSKVDIATGETLHDLAVQNVNTGPVMGFAKTDNGIVAFGGKGIALQAGSGFQPLTLADPLVSTRVTGIVEAENGDWWLNSAAGISVLPLEEIKKSLRDVHYKSNTYPFSSAEERAPLRFVLSTGGSAHKDGLNRLYFGTTDGVVTPHIDESPTLEPKLEITQVVGDGFTPGPHNVFRAGTRVIRIQYLGIHLSDPQQVIYRYRLSGSDTDWQDVGLRREAVYTNLGAGKYCFEVMASSKGGEWTGPVRGTPFNILPRFWQTWWFLASTSFALLIGMYGLFQSRLRLAKQRARLLAEERAEERTLIARDLHDTLLQGLQGLLLTFSTVRQRLLHGENVIQMLDESLLATEALITEGRDRISSIRQETPLSQSLRRRLQTLCATLESDTGLSVRLDVTGRTRDLRSSVSEECYLIAREAVRNSLLHASASAIRVNLHFERRLFRMTCRDDGQGFSVLKQDLSKDNVKHWGIAGMRERAASIGAHFRLASDIKRGTQITIEVESKAAFVD